jgi:hypothetical protein
MARRRGDPLFLVPYGHPQTWRGGGVRPGPKTHREGVLRLLQGAQGPGYVLGLDQAATTGWAVVELDQRRVVGHGITKTSCDRRQVLSGLRDLPRFHARRLLVVTEDHSGFPLQSTQQGIGLGVALGRWLELLDIFDHPQRLRIEVTPAEWRRVLGTTARLERDAWKAQAVRWASAVCGQKLESDDEAEAVCIATWGAWDGVHAWGVLDDKLKAA